MSDTRITPQEFLDMSLSSYRRHLIKDLLRLSKKTTLRPYVYFWRANYADKKNKDCLLFIDEDDKSWSHVIEYMEDDERGDADRIGAGYLKLFKVHDLDEDGDEDTIVAIKSAHGSLKRNAVVKHFNNRLLEGDMDFHAILISDIDDFTKESYKAEIPKRNRVKLREFDLGKSIEAIQEVDNLEPFARQFSQVFKSVTPFNLISQLKVSISDLESRKTSGEAENIEEDAEKIDEQIDTFLEDIHDLITEAEDILEDLEFEEESQAEAFGEQIAVLNKAAHELAKLEFYLEESFGIPKD